MRSSPSSARGQLLLLGLGAAAEGVDVSIRSSRAVGMRWGVANSRPEHDSQNGGAANKELPRFSRFWKSNHNQRTQATRVLKR